MYPNKNPTTVKYWNHFTRRRSLKEHFDDGFFKTRTIDVVVVLKIANLIFLLSLMALVVFNVAPVPLFVVEHESINGDGSAVKGTKLTRCWLCVQWNPR